MPGKELSTNTAMNSLSHVMTTLSPNMAWRCGADSRGGASGLIVASSICEVRKEGGADGSEVSAAPGVGEEEASALAGGGDPSSATQRVKHIEPIFLRCTRRLEDSLAVSHSFVRAREEGSQQGGRAGLSPGRRAPACASVGDELQIRLNAILRSSHREGESTRPPGTQIPEEEAAPWPCDASPHQIHHQEGPRPPDDYDTWSQAEDGSSPAGHATPSPPPAAPASPAAPQKCHNSYSESEEETQQSSPHPPCPPRPPRCSIFTISGTLADPFGTSAKYSLRSLSTAHF
ncbi:hypothetical protein E2C01_071416 [Portunus trituberculatus]|uniref:Uncharacterized protein n=1 Tax=Portunus trituberculatus TaxID=210409 RepID=A0A5B7I521_PORTR|nr:hypothetical protein [Portunus trituberculatus]